MELKIYYKDKRYLHENIIISTNWILHVGRGVDKKGFFRKVGSWEENFWFMVAEGKTKKITLCNALKRLKTFYAKNGTPIMKYEYKERRKVK